jgi:hypothetical protein
VKIRNPMRAGTNEALLKAGEPRPGYKAVPRIKADRAKGREGQTNMTFFMAISTNAVLKELAKTRGISMQQLVAEFVDKGLAEAGEPPFKVRDE